MSLFSPLVLPNGASIPNRIGKAAMEENLADADHAPSAELLQIYSAWAEGEVGLIITGNVMVHAEALTGPAGVVLDAQSPIGPFREWADAAQGGGAKVWMQINYPGRQIQADMPGVAWSPSATRVELGKNSKRFAHPQAMTARQINDTVNRFATAARRAEEAGFDGVEIHAAHGYLLSQFLSPLVNQRTDEWGGTLENRARLLLDIVRTVRRVVDPTFTVAVKLNSADFQRGGFDSDDAAQVIAMLKAKLLGEESLFAAGDESLTKFAAQCDEAIAKAEADLSPSGHPINRILCQGANSCCAQGRRRPSGCHVVGRQSGKARSKSRLYIHTPGL